ncbi:unnamed protein product [Danaus chrysippus]|uniref:(African queen) hypothetical protein n=1 Tax=Danaus chrysippus TaxID=151541 RepID=A0A8J2RKM5_9NEOP|nr:unnamed protein product [Danaus chrysippus]
MESSYTLPQGRSTKLKTLSEKKTRKTDDVSMFAFFVMSSIWVYAHFKTNFMAILRRRRKALYEIANSLITSPDTSFVDPYHRYIALSPSERHNYGLRRYWMSLYNFRESLKDDGAG